MMMICNKKAPPSDVEELLTNSVSWFQPEYPPLRTYLRPGYEFFPVRLTGRGRIWISQDGKKNYYACDN